MPVREKTYEQVAREDPAGRWELHAGELRRKPDMTQEHNDATSILAFELQRQLPLSHFRVRSNAGRARWQAAHSYVPDVMVIPVSMMHARSNTPGELEVYSEALPFVAEVWSRSTGEYDVDEKLPQYIARGDMEVWRVHPYERTVTAWRRGSDGRYARTVHGPAGVIAIPSLPGVTIDIATLWL